MPGATPFKLLIVQSRRADDPMSEHEQECIIGKLGVPELSLTVRNSYLETAHADWLNKIDAVILGGSGDFSVHHEKGIRWITPLAKLVETILERKIPAMGLCFGHQLLGQVLGATVKTDEDYSEFGTVEITKTQAGESEPLLQELDTVFSAQTGHSDYVCDVPAGVTLLATGPRTQTQAFKVKEAPFYSTQFHPDLTGAQARTRYLAYQEHLATIVSDATQEKAERFLLEHDDASQILQTFSLLYQNGPV